MTTSGAAEAATRTGWDANAYRENAHFVPELAQQLLEWLEPLHGRAVLDLGCGDGTLTAAIAARGADVIGVDASSEFVDATRRRGITAHLRDGHTLDFDQRFDRVFSNAALHWMVDDPQAVIAGVYAALKPGGRFVAELGAAGNVAPIHQALRAEVAAYGLDADELDPWYFPEPNVYLDQLCAAGFEIERESAFARPTALPGDMQAWLTTLAHPFVQAIPSANRAQFVAAVSRRLAPELRDAQGNWTAPYVRLRFDARRPL